MKISVCMATYNGALFLKQQLDSIIAQLGEEDELVVSDDGSSDATTAILASYGPRLRMVGNDRVGGVVKNFERALTAATGDIIVLADQDDVWLDGRIAAIKAALANGHLVILNGEVVNAELLSTGRNVFDYVGMRRGFTGNLIKNSFIGCCMAFRKELLKRALPFPSGLPWHDWYIGLLAEATGKVVRIETVTLLYRRHGNNASPTGEKSKYSMSKKLCMRLSVLKAVVVAMGRPSR